jgi:hypothetical protein
MANEERNNDLESRVNRLEGMVEQISLRLISLHLLEIQSRLNALELRMNIQIGLTLAAWLSTIGLLVALLLQY